MNALSLYSGGCDGLSLAASWVGIETLAFCETDKECKKLLAQRHTNKPIFNSDTEVTANGLYANGIDTEKIDIILASPPCQCSSVAGKRLGAADERNRWPECLLIVRDVRPRWFMAENVPGLLSVNAGRLFGEILRELAKMGYDAGWCVYGAADIGAPHKRDRLCLVAYRHRNSGRCLQRRLDINSAEIRFMGDPDCGELWNDGDHKRKTYREINASSDTSSSFHDLAYTNNTRLQDTRHESRIKEISEENRIKFRSRWAVKSGLGRVLDGVSCRLDVQRWPSGREELQYSWEPSRVVTGYKGRAARIKMLGNSVVPQWAFVMLKVITEIEKEIAIQA